MLDVENLTHGSKHEHSEESLINEQDFVSQIIPQESHSADSILTIEPPQQQQNPIQHSPLIKQPQSPSLTKLLNSIVINLKKQKNNIHFLLPVNQTLYPSYSTLVSHPMDVSKIEFKLRDYLNVGEMLADLRLIRDNCIAFNGKDAQISHWAGMMVKNAEKMAEKKSNPSIGTSSHSSNQIHRPKRDIHAPSHLQSSPTSLTRASRKNYPEFKFCSRIVRELTHKRHAMISWPFLTPVDYVTLNIPEYPNIIRYPMDLQTIKEKLDQDFYETAEQFEADIRLMFNNCYTFNKPVDDVYLMGKRFERIFDEKWAEKPDVFDVPKKRSKSSGGGGMYSSSESDGADNAILRTLQSQIDLLQKQYQATREKIDRRRKRREERRRSSASRKQKRDNRKNHGSSKKPKNWSSDDDIKQLTLDQIPAMSQQDQLMITEGINAIGGDQIHDVLRIIKEGMPNLPGGSDEIELDINTMDRKTQYRLFKYVQRINRPKKQRKQDSDSSSGSSGSSGSSSSGSD